MLVLSRKQDEFIDIGDNIKVVVVEIQRYKVRLGIDAPRGVMVHRREVTRRIARAEAHARNGTIGLGEEQLDAEENQEPRGVSTFSCSTCGDAFVPRWHGWSPICDKCIAVLDNAGVPAVDADATARETDGEPAVHQCERCRYTFTCIYKDNHQAKGDVCSGFNETMRPPEDPPAAESDTDREVEAIWPTKKPDWEPSAALLNAVDEFSETLWPDAPHWQVKVRDGLLAVCKAMAAAAAEVPA